MGIIDKLASISRSFPEVKKPDSPISVREKIMWTAAALVIFFVMYNVTAFGVKKTHDIDFLQVITASKIGSLLTVGIGPIVLASIFLQLFKGAGLINLDMNNTGDRKKFHEVQKVLAFVLAVLEAAIFVSTGKTILIENAGTLIVVLVIAQIVMGAMILFYLDETISKYGIGSGISLFIAAGVSLSILGGLSNLIFGLGGVTQTLMEGGADAIPLSLTILLPFVFTIFVFLICVYAEGMKVEIPVAYEAIRGIIPKLPLKFFYVSNIPVIFASALLLNIQLFAAPLLTTLADQNWMFGDENIVNYIGFVDSDKTVRDGFIYLITPIYARGGMSAHFDYLLQDTPHFHIPEWIHAIIYVVFLTVTCIFFGIFWAETSNMDAKSVADQLNKSGLQIPGYRRDPRLLEKVLGKYISPLIITSSASVGLLAGLADLTGALGTGTGILLTVGILYKLYEEFEKLKVFDIYPQISRIFA